METLSQLRAAVKKLGFKIKTESFSWGRHAIYVHAESGRPLAHNVFTAEELERWNPLFTFIREHKETVKKIGEEEGVKGLLAGA